MSDEQEQPGSQRVIFKLMLSQANLQMRNLDALDMKALNAAGTSAILFFVEVLVLISAQHMRAYPLFFLPILFLVCAMFLSLLITAYRAMRTRNYSTLNSAYAANYAGKPEEETLRQVIHALKENWEKNHAIHQHKAFQCRLLLYGLLLQGIVTAVLVSVVWL